MQTQLYWGGNLIISTEITYSGVTVDAGYSNVSDIVVTIYGNYVMGCVELDSNYITANNYLITCVRRVRLVTCMVYILYTYGYIHIQVILYT